MLRGPCPWLTLALCALLARPACAQTRPLLTEEAHTRPAGQIALEAGGQAIRAEPNFLTGLPRGRWDAPVLRVVYAPAGNVEMDFEWTVCVGARSDPGFGSVSDFGDVALRAKVRLAGGDPGRPAFAARFGVVLPQTSFGNGLGPNTLRMSVQGLVTLPAGRTLIHANAGLALLDEPLRPHEQRDLFAYGLAGELPLPRGLTVLAEVAGLAGDGVPGADARSEARAGLRGGGMRWRWDAALRRGLSDADGTWGITAGITLTLRL